LGISKKEVDAVIDEIIEFSEIEDFIDTPVQYYSSGMKVRLGFSVAVHMKPDVLILDEVLAVGDSGFKIKSFNKINEMMRSAAVIFVSHSMPHIANITNKVLLMENGVADYYGEDISEGIDRYFNEFSGNDPKAEFEEFAQLEEMTIHPSPQYEGEELPAIEYRDDIIVDLKLRVDRSIDWFHIKLQISDKDLKIVGIYDSFHDQEPIENNREVHDLRVTIPKSIFINGDYGLSLFIQQRDKENSRWNLLGLYRYWQKFKMKSSEGLGFVPSVVYLPGTVEEKMKINA